MKYLRAWIVKMRNWQYWLCCLRGHTVWYGLNVAKGKREAAGCQTCRRGLHLRDMICNT